MHFLYHLHVCKVVTSSNYVTTSLSKQDILQSMHVSLVLPAPHKVSLFPDPWGYYHSSHAQPPQALVIKHLIHVVGARPGFMSQTL